MEQKINKLLTKYNFTDKNQEGRIKYIVIHYVGATGGAESNCKYFAEAYRGASAHYFVGFAGEIWQAVEDEDIAWHCGASSYKHKECRNSNSIGIELCVKNKGNKASDSKDWYFEDATVESAIELTRELMKKYNVPANHVLRHYDVTGKICPNPYVYNKTEHTWKIFKNAISKSDKGQKESKNDNTDKTKVGEAKEESTFQPYSIKTTCDALNIRKGAGMNTSVVGCIRESENKKKLYTIVEEFNGWGRLKSGAGWICLAYTVKAS